MFVWERLVVASLAFISPCGSLQSSLDGRSSKLSNKQANLSDLCNHTQTRYQMQATWPIVFSMPPGSRHWCILIVPVHLNCPRSRGAHYDIKPVLSINEVIGQHKCSRSSSTTELRKTINICFHFKIITIMVLILTTHMLLVLPSRSFFNKDNVLFKVHRFTNNLQGL